AALVPWPASPLQYLKPYLSTKIRARADGKAYCFGIAAVAIDADGAPNAYHPGDVGKHGVKGAKYIGLDSPEDAGYRQSPKDWPNVIVPDPKDPSTGYIQ